MIDKRTWKDIATTLAADGATFNEVPAGSLPRNHVGFFTSKDGVPYRVATLSPSTRYGIASMQTFVDYEAVAS